MMPLVPHFFKLSCTLRKNDIIFLRVFMNFLFLELLFTAG